VQAASDDELVSAIEQAYRDDFRRFLSLAAGMLGDVEAGRDAVQEAFARAMRSRHELRDLERLPGWLWRSTVNACLEEKRRRRNRPQELSEVAPDGGTDSWPEVRLAVAALPERQRLVLFLRHYADLDYDGIADVVGTSRGTVAATLNAAHRKVREAIAVEAMENKGV
jgi:RNA polymerase sigma factor (sigma-70 family)